MSNETVTNRAKLYQLALFPLNNGATNVYFVLILSYIAIFGSKVLGLLAIFASLMVTGMRVFDAITDPIIGALMDKTNTKFGKFRPFMVIGNAIMAVSVIVLYCFTPMIPETMMWARYTAYVLLYAVWVIGYTFQTSVTRAAQPVLTNDPKQRPLFTIFNTVGSLAGMGIMQGIGPILANDNIFGDYNAQWFAAMAPIGIIVSILLTALAIFGIAEKDNEKYFGIGDKSEPPKIREYIEIIKANKPLQRLMVAGGGCKLAMAIGTNMTVLCMLYGCMMGDYDGLYLPLFILGYVFAVPFFVLTVQTSQKHGQKKSLMTYVGVALACYVVVLALLFMWNPSDPAFNLSIMNENGLALNLYTILFIIFFGTGYGAYYATADMPIPMVADCADYETYRSGKYVPGLMGTLFSFVDKIISSFAPMIAGLVFAAVGFADHNPVEGDPVTMELRIGVAFLAYGLIILGLICNLIAMKFYPMTKEKMAEIQDKVAAIKAAAAAEEA